MIVRVPVKTHRQTMGDVPIGEYESRLSLRRLRNPTQLTRIEPVQMARLAGVDHEIAGSTIEMAQHRVRTDWTVDRAIARGLTSRWNRA